MMAGSCLRSIDVKRRYGPDDKPRDRFYVPMLRSSVGYDRVGGYFSSRLLENVADDALRYFVANGGTMRMVVHAQLREDEVEAINDGLALRNTVDQDALRRIIAGHVSRTDLGFPTEKMALVGQLVAAGVLDIKVGVVLDEQGRPAKATHPRRAIFHAKEGVFRDQCGHAVAFEGSVNESVAGWTHNFERITTYVSWEHSVWEAFGESLADDFAEWWGGNIATRWVVVDLPAAKRQELIEYRQHFPQVTLAPPADDDTEDDVDADDATASSGDVCAEVAEIMAEPWAGLTTAPVTPWPHQDATVRDAVRTVRTALSDPTSPVRGRVFSDEVGLGKTIEVGLAVRQLIVESTAKRVLIAVPASVADQWQGELAEKMNLWVPQVVGPTEVKWLLPDGTVEHEFSDTPDDLWRDHDVLLASSHRVRMSRYRDRVLDAGWDIVVVDEAHHGRRKEKNKPGTANDLLKFLRTAKTHPQIGSILLATATPMQMDVHEARDLLDIVGLPDEWRDDTSFKDFYDQLARPDYADRNWGRIRELVAASIDTFGRRDDVNDAVKDQLGAAAAARITQFHTKIDPSTAARKLDEQQRAALDASLAGNAPLRHLVLRSTRDLLRDYQRSGVLAADVTIPVRDVRDVLVDMPPAERQLYDDIETWVSTHYQAARAAKQNAAGFVMTVYRRRLTSSLEAIRISLQRRLTGLSERRELTLADLVDTDDVLTGDEDAADAGIDPDTIQQANAELLEAVGGIEGEIDHVTDFLVRLDDVLAANGDKDAKFDALTELLDQTVTSGRHPTAIIFTQFSDTLNWLTAHLTAKYGYGSVATFHGGTGRLQQPDGTWRTVGKSHVVTAFRAAATNPGGTLRFLIGTDSMSEGLNLQTCDLLINYDLPWNFMRLEQRIGRIDRIGGPKTAHVRNLVIAGTVEEQVRTGIDADHNDFQHVVGATGAVIEHVIKNAATTGDDPDIDALRDAIANARERSFTLDSFNTEGLLGREGDTVWTFDRGDILTRLQDALDRHEAITLTAAGGTASWRGHDLKVTFDPAAANGDHHLLTTGHPAMPCVHSEVPVPPA